MMINLYYTDFEVRRRTQRALACAEEARQVNLARSASERSKEQPARQPRAWSLTRLVTYLGHAGS
jgi:hypothetical protein